jgi:Flp pilus assembly protein TadB
MRGSLRSLGTLALGALSRLYPWGVDPSEELTQSLRFLGWEVDVDLLVRAGYGAGAVAGGLCAIAVVVVPASVRPVVALFALAVALGTTHAVHSLPQLWATARRTSALGAAPDLVARAVLSMRLSPTPERAAAFTAQSGDGLLATDLRRHIQQAQATADSGLVSFGDAWADQFPSLRRSFALVAAAGSTPDHDRGRLLDRALAVVLEGASEQMRSFAAQIRTPVTALYAFGILLPIALVALLPAAGVVGVVVTPLTVVLVYNLVLPLVLVGAATWLLARRPIAFPPPDVTTAHPEVTDRTRLALLAGLCTAVAGALAAAQVFPWWGPPVAAVGLGCGVALWIRYRSVVGVYDRLEQIEAGLPDALTLVGRRVANGRAVETALVQAGAELDDATGDVLRAGVTRQRQLQVGVREAFLGDHGALTTVPSRRVRGSMALLALAGEEGRPAGSALLALGEHLDDLQRIESKARHSLDHVCQTLWSTGVLFGPLVAGATVGLADSMGTNELVGGTHLTWLGGPVGLYVLLLAVLLSALSTGLTRGVDSALVGYRSGRALVGATVTYLGAYLVVGGLI